jgi:anthranilate phosphoribosyltransferase
VLRGAGPPGARAAVVLNAACALYVASDDAPMDVCVGRAREALTEGAGIRALDRMRDAYVRARAGAAQ